MQLFQRIIDNILDVIFPPTKIWNEIKTWSKEDVLLICKKTGYKNAIFKYQDLYIKEMIYSIKFRGVKYFAEIFGEIMWDTIKDKRGILVPIPISKTRKKERGYNQCEWICEGIKKHDYENNLEYDPDILKRIKHTQKQSWSKLDERKENIKDVFSVEKDITGKTIILIDDVITTGSTIEEAKRTLLKYGAKNVYFLTIAH